MIRHIRPLSLLLSGSYHRAGSEVEWLGHKLAHIREAGVAGGNFTHYYYFVTLLPHLMFLMICIFVLLFDLYLYILSTLLLHWLLHPGELSHSDSRSVALFHWSQKMPGDCSFSVQSGDSVLMKFI